MSISILFSVISAVISAFMLLAISDHKEISIDNTKILLTIIFASSASNLIATLALRNLVNEKKEISKSLKMEYARNSQDVAIDSKIPYGHQLEYSELMKKYDLSIGNNKKILQKNSELETAVRVGGQIMSNELISLRKERSDQQLEYSKLIEKYHLLVGENKNLLEKISEQDVIINKGRQIIGNELILLKRERERLEIIPTKAKKMVNLKKMISAVASDGIISYDELGSLQAYAKENEITLSELKNLIGEIQRERPGGVTIQSNPQDLSNKEKGDLFERYVVAKFEKNLFKLIEWRSDKIATDGQFARSSMQPDIEYEFTLRGRTWHLAIECKWRNNFTNDTINWCYEAQLQRYKEFSNRRNIPVFVILGIGGMPQDPQYVFIIPLNEINQMVISREFAFHYLKRDKSARFYFDVETEILH